MVKSLLRIFILLVFLCIVVPVSYAQDTTLLEDKSDYRTVAVGFDVLNTLVSLLYEVFSVGGNVEYAVTRNFSVLVDVYYASYIDIVAYQVGGGARYYLDGKGLNGGWVGGYGDIVFGDAEGFEIGILGGYKRVFSIFFIDPFVGFRYQSPQNEFSTYYRFGVMIGICF